MRRVIPSAHSARHVAAAEAIDLDGDVCDSIAALHAARDAALQERDALRAILEGRTTPPTDEEIRVHRIADGAWLYSDGHGTVFGTAHDPYTARWCRETGHAVRWWPLRDGRPCAWPKVSP